MGAECPEVLVFKYFYVTVRIFYHFTLSGNDLNILVFEKKG